MRIIGPLAALDIAANWMVKRGPVAWVVAVLGFCSISQQVEEWSKEQCLKMLGAGLGCLDKAGIKVAPLQAFLDKGLTDMMAKSMEGQVRAADTKTN
jgi:hypothetical protein